MLDLVVADNLAAAAALQVFCSMVKVTIWKRRHTVTKCYISIPL